MNFHAQIRPSLPLVTDLILNQAGSLSLASFDRLAWPRAPVPPWPERHSGFLRPVFSVVILFTHREMDRHTLNVKRLFGLALLTAVALLIHGYHPYAEDAEIYLPGVLKILNPSLFPANAVFFGEHAGHTLYPNLIAFSVRATHLPLPWVAFLWHLASIFLLLAGAWRLAAALFESESLEEARARWAAVALMAS